MQTPKPPVVIKHKAPGSSPAQQAPPDEALQEAMRQVVAPNIGPIRAVMGDMDARTVNITTIVVEPTEVRPYITIMTCGMASRPMPVPPGISGTRFAELYIDLPPDWPFPEFSKSTRLPADQMEAMLWPVTTLRELARTPHIYNTSFAHGHTITNGNPPKPLTATTEQCGFLFTHAATLPPLHTDFEVDDGRIVKFLKAFPLYQDEMDFAVANGSGALMAKFGKHVPLHLDPTRPSALKRKRFGLF